MKNLRFVGLDVHKDTITIAVADAGKAAPQVVATVPHDLQTLLRQLGRLAKSGDVRCCYEAGPTGTMLCRELRAKGFECIIVAPSMVPHSPGDHIKTDRRDAVRLARFFRSGDLTDVYVLDAQTEALRDLVRARDQAKRAERRARVQLQAFLLRQGRRWPQKTCWTRDHKEWIRGQVFEYEAHNRVLVGLVLAAEQATEQVARLTKDLEQIAQACDVSPLVHALQALRGVKLVTAAAIAAEVGNFERFPTAPSLMAYLGLVPSESSSGKSQRRGAITRSGNTYVRRALVEAAWAYRHRPGVTRKLRVRQEGISEEVKKTAWKAQLHLSSRFRTMTARGKTKQLVVVAIARELTGFVWAIARQRQLLAA